MSLQTDTDQDVVTGINVTPLVDIMLVLLIVFMVTAHFVQDAGLKVNLPKVQTTEPAPTPALSVVMDARGTMKLMGESVDMQGLKANLEREAGLNPGVRVTLAADEALPYRDIVAVLDVIKKAGVKRVALAGEN